MKAGKSRVLYGVSEEFPVVAVVGLGEKGKKPDPNEEFDETKEAVRTAVAGKFNKNLFILEDTHTHFDSVLYARDKKALGKKKFIFFMVI